MLSITCCVKLKNSVRAISKSQGAGIAIIALILASGVIAYEYQNGSRSTTTLLNAKISLINLGNNTSPLKLTYDATNRVVYVSNFDNGDIYAINADNNILMGTIFSGAVLSSGIAYDPRDNGLYLTGAGNREIVRVDASNSSNVQSVAISGRPGDIIYVPSIQKLAVAIGDESIVDEFGTLSNITSTIHVPCPENLAFDDIQNSIYVSDACANSVLVFDAVDGKEIGNISVGLNPIGLAFDSKDGIVFVANANSNSVSAINCSTMKVLSTIALGNQSSPVQLAYTSRTGEVYVSDQGTDSISVINVSTLSVTRTIRVSGSPYGIIYDPDNGKIYAATGTAITIIPVA